MKKLGDKKFTYFSFELGAGFALNIWANVSNASHFLSASILIMLFLCRSSAECSQILTQLVIALSEVAFHVSKLVTHAERTKIRPLLVCWPWYFWGEKTYWSTSARRVCWRGQLCCFCPCSSFELPECRRWVDRAGRSLAWSKSVGR